MKPRRIHLVTVFPFTCALLLYSISFRTLLRSFVDLHTRSVVRLWLDLLDFHLPFIVCLFFTFPFGLN